MKLRGNMFTAIAITFCEWLQFLDEINCIVVVIVIGKMIEIQLMFCQCRMERISRNWYRPTVTTDQNAQCTICSRIFRHLYEKPVSLVLFKEILVLLIVAIWNENAFKRIVFDNWGDLCSTNSMVINLFSISWIVAPAKMVSRKWTT